MYQYFAGVLLSASLSTCPEEAEMRGSLRVICHPHQIEQLRTLELNKTILEKEEETETQSLTTRKPTTTTARLSSTSITTTTTTTTATTTTTTSTTTTSTTTTTSVTTSQELVQCYSCGSLLSSETSDCAEFDPEDPAQRVTCGPGEACLYYAWQLPTQHTGQSSLLTADLSTPGTRLLGALGLFAVHRGSFNNFFPL